MRIVLDDVSYRIGSKALVNAISLDIPAGTTLGLVGPNGSGKSTLLRCLTGLRRPTSGRVRYDDADIARWKARERARRLAFVEQSTHTDSELRVRDVVGLGRLVHRSRWEPESRLDEKIITETFELFDLEQFRDRHWQRLSGGERQRVHLARAWAQSTPAVALDEPTNHLDIRHQLELLNLVRRSERTAVVALHDLNLAVRFCDLIAILNHGRLVAAGPPATTLTTELMCQVFGVTAQVVELPGGPVLDLAGVTQGETNA